MIRLRTQTGPNCKRKMKSLSVEVEAEAYSVVSSASKFRLNLSSGELKPNPDDEARFTWTRIVRECYCCDATASELDDSPLFRSH